MSTVVTAQQQSAWDKMWSTWLYAEGEPWRSRPTLADQIARRYIRVPGNGQATLPLPLLKKFNGTLEGFGPKVSLLAAEPGNTFEDDCNMIRDVRIFGGSLTFQRDSANNNANFNTIRNVVLQDGYLRFEGTEFTSVQDTWGIRSNLWYANGLNQIKPPPTCSRHTLTNVGFDSIRFHGNVQHVIGQGIWCPRIEFHAHHPMALDGGGSMGRRPYDIRLEGVYSDSREVVGGVSVYAYGFDGNYPDDIVINGRKLAEWVKSSAPAVQPVQPVQPQTIPSTAPATTYTPGADVIRDIRRALDDLESRWPG